MRSRSTVSFNDDAGDASRPESVSHTSAPPEEPARSGGTLSLRTVISLVAVVLVGIVAGITLSITSITSLAALRDIGKSHSTALLATVTQRTVGLFEPQIRNIEVLQNLSKTRDWPWPSDDPDTFKFWEDAARYGWFSTQFQDAGVIMYFWDNTRISFSPWNYTHSLHSTIRASPASAPGGLANQTFVNNVTAIDITGRGRDQYLYTRQGELFRTVGTSWGATMRTLTAGGRAASIGGYIVRSASDIRGDTVEKYVTMAAPLHRRSDASNPSSSNLYGIALTALFIDDISSFLAASRATPNTQAFALDARGFLLGSSMSDRPFFTETRIPAGAQASRAGCSASDGAGAVSTGPNTEVCRTSRKDYGYAPLAALPDSVIEPPEPSVMLFSTSGDNFFAAYVTVPLRLPGMTITLVLLMPETDVIGDVVKSRNVAIGIVAALVVVAAAVNFAVIFVLLAPLEAIAGRMRKAANLEDDGEEEGVSAMAEVAALQEAYYEMNEELNRIRSFVPQSVLMAKKQAAERGAGEEEEDDEGDLDLEAEESILQRSSGSSVGGIGRRASRMVASRRASVLRTSSNLNPPSGMKRTTSGLSMASARTGTGPVNPAKARVAAATDVRLKPANVTILAANLCGFNQLLAAAAKDAAVAHITDMVDFVCSTVAKNGGVIASYHGDHFVATFNAVKSCGNHPAAAARTGVELRDGADAVGFGTALRVGIATGRCHVGNLGNKEVKAFSTVGPAYQHASVLERMGRLYGESDERSVLATRRTCVDIANHFRFRYVDIVPLPGRERGGAGATITAIATIVRAIDNSKEKRDDANDDEWLYLVGSADKNDPNAKWNQCFESLLNGKTADAAALLDSYNEEQPVSQADAEPKTLDPAVPGEVTTQSTTQDTAAHSGTSKRPSFARFDPTSVAEEAVGPKAARVPLEAPANHRERVRSLLAKDTSEMFADLGTYYMSAFDMA